MTPDAPLIPTTRRRRAADVDFMRSLLYRAQTSMAGVHASSWLLTRDDLLCRLVRSGNEYVAGKRSFNRTARREDLLLALERVDVNRFEGNAIQFGPMRRINPSIVC